MIATLQFDLSNDEDKAALASLLGFNSDDADAGDGGDAGDDKPKASTTKKKRRTKAEIEAEKAAGVTNNNAPAGDVDPFASKPTTATATNESDPFASTTSAPKVVPTLAEMGEIFSNAQAVSVERAGKCMKEFLAKEKCASGRDLNDMQRYELKKLLDEIIHGTPFD